MGDAVAARYLVDPVEPFLDANAARYAADGLPLPEIQRARREVRDWDSWWPYWMARSERLEAYAHGSPRTDETRSSLLVLSMLCAHLAQYLHFHSPEERASGLRRKIDVYRRAGEYLDPPLRPVTIPYGDQALPGYVRVPDTTGPPLPCVVYVGGLDAHKEDAHGFLDLCLARGCAVLSFDGPGQGEALLRGVALDDFAHTAVGAAVDVAASIGEIDPDRIGVIGRSLGGYLAPRAAADHDGIRALAVWGAMYDLNNFRDLPSHTRAGFQFITGAATESETIERVRFISMSGAAHRIRCRTLIVHGGADRLTPPDKAQRMAREIGERCRLELYEGSPHCNHDIAHLVRPLLADWLALELG